MYSVSDRYLLEHAGVGLDLCYVSRSKLHPLSEKYPR